MSQIPRSRGALSGVLLVLLGVWGGLVQFIGPYWDYAYSPNSAWTYNSGRLYFAVLPAIATLIGGLIVLASANRMTAMLGGWLAAIAGAWYVVGLPLGSLWGIASPGSPVGDATMATVETIGMFLGLGVVIVFVAALALGRFAVVGVREVEAQRAAQAREAERARQAEMAAEAERARQRELAEEEARERELAEQQARERDLTGREAVGGSELAPPTVGGAAPDADAGPAHRAGEPLEPMPPAPEGRVDEGGESLESGRSRRHMRLHRDHAAR